MSRKLPQDKNKSRLGARRAFFERLEDRSLLAATPQLVADINAKPLGSIPNNFAVVGKTTFFVADDGIHGRELWKTDGTAAGTKIVKDIRGGYLAPNGLDTNVYLGSNPSSNPKWLTSFKGKVFFSADDGMNGIELWVSDGTAKGTKLLKDLSVQGYAVPSNFTVVGQTLYFTASTGAGGSELWKTDGTSAGTRRVARIDSKNLWSLSQFVAVNDKLFFVANDKLNGAELWVSDGTAAGTKMVMDIRPGHYVDPDGDVVQHSSFPENLTAVGGRLYFSADNGIHGRELWTSDGTRPGTRRVKNITTGAGSTFGKFVDFNGTLVFSVNDAIHGAELWTSQGTAATTLMLKDINPGGRSSSPDQFLVIGKRLYFAADNGVHGTELWRSNGTEAGTRRIKNITTGGSSAIGGLVNHNGKLFFAANDGVHGLELWTSNGSASGTSLVVDIDSNSSSSIDFEIVSANGRLLFGADDGLHGLELWQSDGTEQGTSLVEDIQARTVSSNPEHLTDVNGTLFFTATDQRGVFGLWKSTGGGPAGAVFVKAINLSSNMQFISFEGALYFSTSGDDGSTELWRSDGTTDGTVLVKNIAARPRDFVISPLVSAASKGPSGVALGASAGAAASVIVIDPGWRPRATIADLAVVGGRLYLAVRQSTLSGGMELWHSDGTSNGTSMFEGFEGQDIGGFVDFNGTLLFSARDKLYRADETQGVALVKDVRTELGGSITNVTNVDGVIYFTVHRSEAGAELWKSNGTTEGTVLVKAFEEASPGPFSQFQLGGLASLPGTLYFWVKDPSEGTALWKSDGTTDGTVLVKQVNLPTYSPDETKLVQVGNKLFFTAKDEGGIELWMTDGTPTGTLRVKDINPGMDSAGNPISSRPLNLTAINGKLFFTADDGVQGYEVWTSDGTSEGTVRVKSLYPGVKGSSPADFVFSGGKMYFTADDFVHGRELWSLEVAPPVVASGSGSLSGGTITVSSGTLILHDAFMLPGAMGDLDGDGDIDGADFVAWQTSYVHS